MLRNGLVLTLLWAVCAGAYAEQRRPQTDAATQLLNYYRRYPERYIRISDETWSYDPVSRSAQHSFTMKNVASTAYYDIEVRFDYQTLSGKTLKTQSVKLEGNLGPLATRQVKIKVKNVPLEAEKVVTAIAKAGVYF